MRVDNGRIWRCLAAKQVTLLATVQSAGATRNTDVVPSTTRMRTMISLEGAQVF